MIVSLENGKIILLDGSTSTNDKVVRLLWSYTDSEVEMALVTITTKLAAS